MGGAFSVSPPLVEIHTVLDVEEKVPAGDLPCFYEEANDGMLVK